MLLSIVLPTYFPCNMQNIEQNIHPWFWLSTTSCSTVIMLKKISSGNSKKLIASKKIIYRTQGKTAKQANMRPIPNHTPSTTSFFPGCMALRWFLQTYKNIGDLKINSRKFFNNKTSTFYCWLYFLTSIIQVLHFLLTRECFACQQNV